MTWLRYVTYCVQSGWSNPSALRTWRMSSGRAFSPALIAAPLRAQTFRFSGYLSARGVYTRSQPSWLTGGFGRFDTGAASATSSATTNVDVAQLGADWTPVSWLDVHVSGQARHDRTA